MFCVPFEELSSLSYTSRKGEAHGSLHLPIQQEMSFVLTNVSFWGSTWNTARKVVMSRDSETSGLCTFSLSRDLLQSQRSV